MREVAIVGVAMTKFGTSEKTQVEMFAEAAMEAINESGLGLKDIQAVNVGNADGNIEEGQAVIAPMCAADIGLSGTPATRFEGACASGTIAIRDAFIWVASGFYDIVLAGGTERQRIMSTPLATRVMGMGVHSRYETPTGLSFPGIFAMMAHLYASKYGIPLPELKEAMARVSFKAHKHGCINPKAQFYGKEVTMQMIYDSAMVASPIQVFDCCPISDGAAAVVVTSADIAKRLTDKPVLIVGTGQGSSGAVCSQKDITRIPARELSAKRAYDMAGLKPEDIDVCELHDCFTIAEIVASEGLGFFEPGQGYKAALNGDTDIGGKIAINPSGGIKAKGHPVGATGAAQVYEIVKQLRGECGPRQVEGAKIGMTDTMGGSFASIGHLILKRGW
ncbi:MAG TPA: propanoyl-CoA acyltransferase [Dehalococcoidia bacterium]|nr:propanoyl-CoA acyltransferase [Dehalococcoidia bacterium]